MQRNTNIHTFLTVKQFVKKHAFLTEHALRHYIRTNKKLREKAIRKIGQKLLINEKKFLEFIEGLKIDKK